MRLVPIGLLLLMAGTAFADKKGEGRFAPGAASSYPSHQTNGNVTVAAVPYVTDEMAHAAFGKVNLYEHGILPVLVVIQNDTDQALKLDRIEVEYVGYDRSRIENTPASDVKYAGGGPRQPKPNMGGPIPPGLIKHKNPLASAGIEERGFAARMLPPHESASGFFYFQTKHGPGAKLYLTGITEPATGKDIVYFEIPLDPGR